MIISNLGLKNKPFKSKPQFELEENIEKHDELNPALFNKDTTLKPEIKERKRDASTTALKVSSASRGNLTDT